MPRLWKKPKKAVDQLREHQKVISNCCDYYSSQAYFDDLDLSIRLTFQQIYLVVSCLKVPSMILLDEHFQMESELLEIITKMIKSSEIMLYFIFAPGDSVRVKYQWMISAIHEVYSC